MKDIISGETGQAIYKNLLLRYSKAIKTVYNLTPLKDKTPDKMTFDYLGYNSTDEIEDNIEELEQAVKKAEFLAKYYKYNYEYKYK